MRIYFGSDFNRRLLVLLLESERKCSELIPINAHARGPYGTFANVGRVQSHVDVDGEATGGIDGLQQEGLS